MTVHDELFLHSLIVTYICVCLFIGAYHSYQLFDSTGHGEVGTLFTWGFILLAVGFVVIGFTSYTIYLFPVTDILFMVIVGRIIQGFAVLCIALGLGKYHAWSIGQFHPYRFSLWPFRRRNPKTSSSEDSIQEGG